MVRCSHIVHTHLPHEFCYILISRCFPNALSAVFDIGRGTCVSHGDEYRSSDADKRREGLETNMSSVWR
jgi:hypothetical protein